MRKAAKQILWCVAGLIVLCVVLRFVFFHEFCIYSYMPENGQGEITVTVEKPEVLRAGKAERGDGFIRIPVFPGEPGDTDLYVNITGTESRSMHVLRVGAFHTIYDRNNENFTGDTALLISVTLFWILVSAIMIWHFFRAKGTAFYDYGTVYYAGFFLFAFVTGLTMLVNTIFHAVIPEQYNMMMVYSSISGASARFMLLTSPLIIGFAIALAVSNIVLLRYEGLQPGNALGLLVSVAMILGEALGLYLLLRDSCGSEWEIRLEKMFENTYDTILIYCQCMLTGAVTCGIKAAKHKPDPDKDFIIILGCWVRKDGTLPPLLRGRADKALSFWKTQKEISGKEACFVPSGGQGKDEPMPEGEAVRRYLQLQGVNDRLIMAETRSVNTYENMCLSGKLIREKNPEGKVIYATSSYHVFRSGILAKRAGLQAEGIGSRTRWWFWPNAFIRETAGLLHKRWKQELLFLAILLIFFGLLSMIL